MRAATAAGVALCCASLYAAPALAHLGGFISLPDFDAPVGLVVTSEPSVALEWRDVNLDPTGVFHFTYQQDGLPATPTPDPALRDGVEFGSVAVTDLANTMDWDLSAVPSGAWHIVAEAVDPPLCPAFRVAPTVVVVRRAGEPMPLGALFYAPFRKQLVTEDVASLDLRAVSETAPTVTIEYGVLDPILVDVGPPEPCTEQPCPISCPTVDRAFVSRGVLVTDAPLSADPDAGPARWRLLYDWDAAQVPEGNYELRADLRTAEGLTLTVYSGSGVTVRDPEPVVDDTPEADEPRPDIEISESPSSDSETAAPEVTDLASPDGASEASAPSPAPAGGGCGSAGPSSSALALAVVLLALTAGRRRARRPGLDPPSWRQSAA